MATNRTAHPLDLNRPLGSLREAAKLPSKELARRRGVQPPSQSEAESQGPRIRLETLLGAAAAAGGELEIIFWVRS